jgi:arginase family enzyme
MTPAGLALIGVPTNSSGTVAGVARAPAVLRQRGLATALARHPGFIDGDLRSPT